LRRRLRPVLGLLALGFVLAFVVGQSPHLVHHLFELSQNQTDCAFASSAERAQGPPAEIVALIPPPGVETGRPVANQPAPPSLALAPSDARAPPLLAS
jgi:hypothetical protein